jgi:hypothetical protein
MATPDLTFNIPGQQPPAPAEPACSRQDGPADEPNLEELLDCYPVPFRRTVTVAVRYQLTGRRKPLPLPLDEAEESEQ